MEAFYAVFFPYGFWYAAVAEVFWRNRPCPVIFLADRLWTALGCPILGVSVWVTRWQHCHYLTSLREMWQHGNWAFLEMSLLQSATENAFSWSFAANKVKRASVCKPSQLSVLYKLQHHLNFIWWKLSIWTNRKWQMSQLVSSAESWGWWSQDPLCKIMKSPFCLFFFSFAAVKSVIWLVLTGSLYAYIS